MIVNGMKGIVRKLSEIPGWHTNKRIIIFESDDWGSIRMPSQKSFRILEKAGLDLRSADAERYNLNDTLATPEDLAGLFDVLSSVKDTKGSNAIFTPVCILANPDFNKIRETDFMRYYYEPITDTFKKYPGCENSFDLWREGISKRLFIPQLHGREHLNVISWMKALRDGEEQTLKAFSEGCWGFVPASYPLVDYQAAFLLNDPSELEYHKNIIIEAISLFEQLLGYRPEYFVPPNGPFNNVLNKTLAPNGIKYRYASKVQYEPAGYGKIRQILHYQGQKSGNGIRYIIRNCFFEPSQEGKSWVDSCLNEINIAFKLHKPAIISTHRVNYIGSLNVANRDRGLRQLTELLKRILKNWPDAEFLTTPQLGQLMDNS